MTDKIPVLFLGTSTVVPEAGNDTSSMLLDGKYLLDTGWHAAINMLQYGVSPLDIDCMFITHCHQDHYLGLPHIFFYLAMNKAKYLERQPIKIIGPKADIHRVVELSLAFLQTEASPVWNGLSFETVGLDPGESFDLPDFKITTCETAHKCQGLCYVFASTRNDRRIAFTGDTGYHEPLAEHVRRVSLLVHDAAIEQTPPGEGEGQGRGRGHSHALEAARIAELAQAEKLALTHRCRKNAEAALAAARKVFPNTVFPQAGETILV